MLVALGGYGAAGSGSPGGDQNAYYFEGTPQRVVPGKTGGTGVGLTSGSGGGGGGRSAQNTAGTPYSTSGFGSLGAVTPGVSPTNAGIAPPLGTPESGSGGGYGYYGAGKAGAQGSGGGGGGAGSGALVAGGNGGAGFVMIEY